MAKHCIIVFLVLLFTTTGCNKEKEDNNKPESAKNKVGAPATYAQLIALSDEELSRVDIARINLLSAEGLPGAENIDVELALWKLDGWISICRQAAKKYFSHFQRNPGRYDYSLAKFKAINLALTIKEDLKCGYNMDLFHSGAMADISSTRFYQNSKDLFLHGFTSANKSGSCASLPVLMVAIGRGLDYPLYLVACKGHLFCRWDDGKERFNIELAIQGVDIKPDDHYYRWPYPTSLEEAEIEGYLVNLNASQELAIFAQLRAACFQENRNYTKAAESYQLALETFPNSKLLSQYLSRINHQL